MIEGSCHCQNRMIFLRGKEQQGARQDGGKRKECVWGTRQDGVDK